MRARALVISALLGAFVLGAATPASADISAFSGDSSYNSSIDAGTAQGQITCTSPENFRVTVRVAQKDPGYRGFGQTTGTCTGSSQTWEVVWEKVSGDLVGGVRTRAVFTAKTYRSSCCIIDKEQFTFLVTPR